MSMCSFQCDGKGVQRQSVEENIERDTQHRGYLEMLQVCLEGIEEDHETGHYVIR